MGEFWGGAAGAGSASAWGVGPLPPPPPHVIGPLRRLPAAVQSPRGNRRANATTLRCMIHPFAGNWKQIPEYKRIFNVRSYGAKGDGTTDDTLAVKQALKAASAAAYLLSTQPCGYQNKKRCLVSRCPAACTGRGGGEHAGLSSRATAPALPLTRPPARALPGIAPPPTTADGRPAKLWARGLRRLPAGRQVSHHADAGDSAEQRRYARRRGKRRHWSAACAPRAGLACSGGRGAFLLMYPPPSPLLSSPSKRLAGWQNRTLLPQGPAGGVRQQGQVGRQRRLHCVSLLAPCAAAAAGGLHCSWATLAHDERSPSASRAPLCPLPCLQHRRQQRGIQPEAERHHAPHGQRPQGGAPAQGESQGNARVAGRLTCGACRPPGTCRSRGPPRPAADLRLALNSPGRRSSPPAPSALETLCASTLWPGPPRGAACRRPPTPSLSPRSTVLMVRGRLAGRRWQRAGLFVLALRRAQPALPEHVMPRPLPVPPTVQRPASDPSPTR